MIREVEHAVRMPLAVLALFTLGLGAGYLAFSRHTERVVYVERARGQSRITFARPFIAEPTCVVVDRSSPLAFSYTLDRDGITILDAAEGHHYDYSCDGKVEVHPLVIRESEITSITSLYSPGVFSSTTGANLNFAVSNAYTITPALGHTTLPAVITP